MNVQWPLWRSASEQIGAVRENRKQLRDRLRTNAPSRVRREIFGAWRDR
jgi:hypothetical protein